MSDPESVIETALLMQPLREPVLRFAIQALQLPSGSRGLDAGCGIGLQSRLLFEAIGPAGSVTGLDSDLSSLDYAVEAADSAGLAGSVRFCQGDVNNIPFDDNTFDWAWSVDCVGYIPVDPLPMLRELVRVVRPGGMVAILAWSSETLLPGYPLLEARLRTTTAGMAPYCKGSEPERHFLRSPGMFRKVGLVDRSAETFSEEACATLTDPLYRALSMLFGMRWKGAEQELEEEERVAFLRLTDPESEEFILRHPDYYAFFTYSMFHGRVPQ